LRRGVIEAAPPAGDVDAEATAIEAGAQDLEPGEDGQTRFLTEPTDLDLVARALTAQGWTIHLQNLAYIAKNPLTLEPDARAEVEAFLEALDADDDVQTLYVGLS
jgi:transcriptional/translational regulatory protein YebC/TACO1